MLIGHAYYLKPPLRPESVFLKVGNTCAEVMSHELSPHRAESNESRIEEGIERGKKSETRLFDGRSGECSMNYSCILHRQLGSRQHRKSSKWPPHRTRFHNFMRRTALCAVPPAAPVGFTAQDCKYSRRTSLNCTISFYQQVPEEVHKKSSFSRIEPQLDEALTAANESALRRPNVSYNLYTSNRYPSFAA